MGSPGKKETATTELGGWLKVALPSSFPMLYLNGPVLVWLHQVLLLFLTRGQCPLGARFWLYTRSRGFLSIPGSSQSSGPSLTRTLPLLVGWPWDVIVPQGYHAGALEPTICGRVVLWLSLSSSLPFACFLLWGIRAGQDCLPPFPHSYGYISLRNHIIEE